MRPPSLKTQLWLGRSRVQLRPVLMVVMVAALGMVPAMVARGIASAIQRPLATGVVGGLASTLILTPLASPAVFWLERLGWRREGRNRDQAAG
jgi:cobalt-zinc-cadmium resistance protein CzcA